METQEYRIALPYPPSINHYWRRVGPRTLISREGRRFREAIILSVLMARRTGLLPDKPLTGRLSVSLAARPPDRRIRDLDNLLKPTLDALQHAGVFDDDGQIDRLDIVRLSPTGGGALVAAIRVICDSSDS